MNTNTFSYKKPSPPPPYGHAVISPEPNSLSGSVTARRIHALANDVFSGAVPSAIEEWINERSREELSSLLVRANEIIRDRERELSMTSELSKNLYHSNITLEKKHKALLARLPTTSSSMTPRTTPSSSPAPTPEHQPTPLPYHKAYHTRRISVSPSDLALLADQNAELLQKLENLEAESAQANLAGRRRLGKLEKEIDVLREELDQYRTRSDALELQAERSEEEAKRRKQEWNERVRAHRSANSGGSWAFSGTGSDVHDFAPGSSVGGGGSRPASLLGGAKLALPTAPDTVTLTPSQDGSDSCTDASRLDAFTFPPRPSRSTSPAPHAGESALFAQLVSKVRELELTNEQILESQRDTATKLHEAQIEAEGIRRLYAFLDERADVELEVVEDGKNDGQPVQDSNVTMRFQSLRRSINGDLRQFSMSSFGKGTGPDVWDNSGPMKSLPLKARKTVVGLFDTPTQQSVDGTEPSVPVNDPPSSPALSLLELPACSPLSQQISRTHTLGSELGSDYGSDYAENHHLRSSSLYDVFLSGPSAPSRPTTPTPLHNSQLSSDLLPNELQSLKPCQDLEKTPQRIARKADRPHRLSDTIRARTHFWVDKRFHYNTTPVRRPVTRHRPESGNGSAEGQIAALKPAVAQVAVQTMTDGEERNLALVRVDTAGELQSTSGVEVAPLERKRSRATRMVLELWLWVQFVIVILVFLWAVTKRGPRSILHNAERVKAR
ncbi:hypothetical protein EDB87DRAFT_1605161 [Lactarius vividus]|nr:hypothetical protein EDB87DRAFT_1605161 [Lactarius vividus]